MSTRLLLFWLSLGLFALLYQLPLFYAQLLPWLEPPAPAKLSDSELFAEQIEKFVDRLPKTEPIGYRLRLKPDQLSEILKVQSDLVWIKFMICPTVMNEKPDGRSLKTYITNTDGQLNLVSPP